MFQILTDSGCDLLTPCAAVAPLTVIYDAHTAFPDGQMAPEEFYAGIRAGKLPQTAAVNPEGWAGLMEPVLDRGEDVLTLTMSAALSATYQSAVIAAQELRERYPQRSILVLDSTTASHALGLLVQKAVALRDGGMSLQDVAGWVEAHKKEYCVWLTVEDLMHLKRGGRLGAASAVMGTMLQIKPLLCLNDGGRLEQGPKARGRRAAISALCERVRTSGLPGENQIVAVGHAACPQDAEALARLLKAECGVEQVYIGSLGNVIGAHAGPGALTVCFVGNSRNCI